MQVKIWFQNRRVKHKKEDVNTSVQGSPSNSKCHCNAGNCCSTSAKSSHAVKNEDQDVRNDVAEEDDTTNIEVTSDDSSNQNPNANRFSTCESTVIDNEASRNYTKIPIHYNETVGIEESATISSHPTIQPKLEEGLGSLSARDQFLRSHFFNQRGFDLIDKFPSHLMAVKPKSGQSLNSNGALDLALNRRSQSPDFGSSGHPLHQNNDVKFASPSTSKTDITDRKEELCDTKDKLPEQALEQFTDAARSPPKIWSPLEKFDKRKLDEEEHANPYEESKRFKFELPKSS